MTRTFIVLLTTLLAAPAWGQGKDIVVGLFFPALPETTRAARIKAVEDLASHLASKIGQPVKGRSFARAADLNLAVKQRVVQLAIVDASFAAERRWAPLAMLSFHGSRTMPWQVLAKAGISTISDLKGKTLAFPSIGKADRQFISNVLFEGEVPPSYFTLSPSPDASSAIRAVGLGKAAATVVYGQRAMGGLTSVYVSRDIPTPSIVHVGRLPAPVQKAVLQGLLSWQGGWLGFDGWKPVEAGLYPRLASALASKPVRRMIAPKPQAFVIQAREVFAGFQPPRDLPSVLGLMTPPTAKPDLRPVAP
jgi:hypothetical protein